MQPIHLAIIEDEPMIRENLELFFQMQSDIELVLTSGSVEDFLKGSVTKPYIEMILLDIGLPGMSGLEGIRPIKNRYPSADILILTAISDSEKIFKALCAGAVSYITKRADLFTIKEALMIVKKGGSFMSPVIARKIIDHFSPKAIASNSILTPRQEQIVQGLVDGLSYKMIADKYMISLETVRDHIKKIYKRLNVNSKAEVIRKKMNNEI